MEHLTKLIQNRTPDVSDRDIYEGLAIDVSTELGVDLVSIWLFDDAYTKIKCVFSLDRNHRIQLTGAELLKSQYPTYFKAIIEEITIMATDVHTHHSTKELSEDYFQKNGILSLLDYIIYNELKPVGVICCETTACQRRWTEDDIYRTRLLTVAAGFELSL